MNYYKIKFVYLYVASISCGLLGNSEIAAIGLLADEEAATLKYVFAGTAKNTAKQALLSFNHVFMRPSSLGGGRILRRILSVCPSVPLSDEVEVF